mgnify:CR=1 FL=1
MGPIFNVTQFSHRLTLIPDQLQGRVNSTFRLFAFGFNPLGAALSGLLIERVGRENFAATPAPADASWVGYRLAEMLPLPLPIKQSMLEINDSEVRLKVIAQFLKDKEIL